MYYLKVTDYDQVFHKEGTYSYYETIAVRSYYREFYNAVDVVNHLTSEHFNYLSQGIDWKRVALTKVYDELYLEVPFERIKYEYEQAPWRVYPFRGIRYGYKKVYHRHFKPKYIHRWKELAEAKVDDILIPKPYVRDSEVSRHRTKLSTHRTWKRFRKTQYK